MSCAIDARKKIKRKTLSETETSRFEKKIEREKVKTGVCV